MYPGSIPGVASSSIIDRQTAFGGPTADAARPLLRISGATDFERATVKAARQRSTWQASARVPVGRIANGEMICSVLNLCYAAKYCCHAASDRDSFGIPAYMSVEILGTRRLPQRASSMTPLALSALIDTAPRWLGRLGRYWTEFSNGIEEARAMALRYQTLAALSDPELAARGLKRQDIPRAVLGVFGGV